MGSYTLLLNRHPRHLADMEWDTINHARDMDLSANCLTGQLQARIYGFLSLSLSHMAQQQLLALGASRNGATADWCREWFVHRDPPPELAENGTLQRKCRLDAGSIGAMI